MTPACSTCMFWKLLQESDGECRINPPDAQHGWPSTKGEDSCGKYAPKEGIG